MVNTGDKICFVMSPIGDEGTETRVRADQVLHYLIEPAVGHFNYSAIRADDMPTPGMITPQIIERVLESPRSSATAICMWNASARLKRRNDNAGTE